jgi:hypothetical protein
MTTKDGKYDFKVNGAEFQTEYQNPTALEILMIAKQGGAIPNNPEEYVLQSDKGLYQGVDRVNLEEDNVFLTIPVSPTQVA